MIRLFVISAAAMFFVACAENELIPRDPNVRVAPVVAPKNDKKPVARSEKSTTDILRSMPETEIKPGVISQIDLQNFFQLQQTQKALIVDVRPAVFYVLNHIPDAISFPLKSFDKNFPQRKNKFDAAVEAEKIIVLYCTDQDCPDARAVATRLSSKGYNVAIYPGGWAEWKQSGI